MYILQLFKILGHKINIWPLQKNKSCPLQKRIEQLIVGFQKIVIKNNKLSTFFFFFENQSILLK